MMVDFHEIPVKIPGCFDSYIKYSMELCVCDSECADVQERKKRKCMTLGVTFLHYPSA